MVKSGAKSSSASSATRKKHARKAATKDAPPTDVPNMPKDKKPKGKDKGKNKEPPRKKAYVQPVKPQPVQQDPIDALGLAQRLPPELLVVLRGLSKKDTVTKTKALEELRVGWIDRVQLLSDSDADAYARLDALTLSLPIWVRVQSRACLVRIITLSGICGRLVLPDFAPGRCTTRPRSSCTPPAACACSHSRSTPRSYAQSPYAPRSSSTSAKSRPQSKSNAS